ncbi:PilN domain-containing protein [Anaeroselena agilis]|uniref:PilN domain-containing protein n=1 Tax=Anaeroselena agilis TaxID=3063788 RepID=A0ABU3NYC4_9FIRM|nr:PilN domain-containing protein [Selenomonadales bacterium 4137-cl]
MIRINLLPPAERRPKWRTGRIFGTLIVLVLGALLGVWGYLQFMLVHTERNLEEAKNRLQLLQPAREAMLAANSRQQGVDAKDGVLIALTRDRTSWYAVLTQLGAKTPPELWYTDLTVDNKGALKLLGMAKSTPDLAAFMRKLEHDDLFADPTLVKAERDILTYATKFEITLKIKGR